MTEKPLTREELMELIPAAVRAGDFETVERALKALAAVDPRAAQNVYDVLRIASELRDK